MAENWKSMSEIELRHPYIGIYCSKNVNKWIINFNVWYSIVKTPKISNDNESRWTKNWLQQLLKFLATLWISSRLGLRLAKTKNLKAEALAKIKVGKLANLTKRTVSSISEWEKDWFYVYWRLEIFMWSTFEDNTLFHYFPIVFRR